VRRRDRPASPLYLMNQELPREVLDEFTETYERGMASVHRYRSGTSHGAETQHTLRWIAPGRIAQPYHCDYLWISPDLKTQLRGCGIGTMDHWVESGLSDHVPVWADLDLQSET
jgi:endonuclease/exonuclease/phosphatase family metal-dependent hydrolase